MSELITYPYIAFSSGQEAGELVIEVADRSATVILNVDNNGRGMKHRDDYTFDEHGTIVTRWLRGNSMVGAPVEEKFALADGIATWTSPADEGQCESKDTALYVSCENNAYSVATYTRLAVEAGGTIDVLPRGTVSAQLLRPVHLDCAPGLTLSAFAVSGITLVPVQIVVDQHWVPVAYWAVTEAFLRTDAVGTDSHKAAAELVALGGDLGVEVAGRVGALGRYRLTGPVRIRNVRVFHPDRGVLSEPAAVTVYDDRIVQVERIATLTPADPDLAEIDGEGGTLVPGLHDMHAHVGVMPALLYTIIGVTTARDMGNDAEELASNIRRWRSGELPGPYVDYSGFIERLSPFSAKTGRVVTTLEEGIEAVRWYARRGYSRIKIYNSIDPEWVPTLSAEARRLGLETLGHVPAFTTPTAMIQAGYCEVTHINQLLLGWLLEPHEDSRTLLRLMGLVRAENFDIDSAEVEAVIDLMRANRVGLDTTLMAMEELMRLQPGTGLPEADDGYLDKLPVGYQRQRKLGVLPIPADQRDNFYRAFDTLLALAGKLFRAGIPLWPGTDQLYSYTLQRELELYVQAGLTPSEALRSATIDSARRLGTDHVRGSIEQGKIADFFLVAGNPLENIRAIRDVRLVAQAGRLYSPPHMHDALGFTRWIEPVTMTYCGRPVEPGS